MKTQIVPVRFEPKTYQKLQALQTATRWSMSQVIRELVNLSLMSKGTLKGYGEILETISTLSAAEVLGFIDALNAEINQNG